MPVCDEKKGHTDPSFTPTSEPRLAKDTMTFGCPKWKTIARCIALKYSVSALKGELLFFLLIEWTYI